MPGWLAVSGAEGDDLAASAGGALLHLGHR